MLGETPEALVPREVVERQLAKIDPLPLAPHRTYKDGKPRRHMVLPDTQTKPGAPWDHMVWAGRYAVAKRPDVIVHLGDHWDFPSLSSWDKGKKAAENKRYWSDVLVGNAALAAFTAEIRKVKMTEWNPRLVILMGNHENRVERWLEEDPAMEGTIGYHHLNAGRLGWHVQPFLHPIEIDGIRYNHFFPRSASKRVTQTRRGQPNARVQVQREMASCTAGHLQGLDVHYEQVGDTVYRGVIAGSFYQHEEGYLDGAEGNYHWRGLLMKNEVDGRGGYDLTEVSMDFLRGKYA